MFNQQLLKSLHTLQTEALAETTAVPHKKTVAHQQRSVLPQESPNADKLHAPRRDWALQVLSLNNTINLQLQQRKNNM